MSDTLSETAGCDLLARLFRSRGYAIARNVDFHEYGVSFHVDGWDAKARVGFEFLTSEDDDHDDLTLDEYKSLMAAQQRGELALFIIDEVEPLSATALSASAIEFLDEVAAALEARRAGGRRGGVAGRAASGARKKSPVAGKARAGKKVVKRKAATKPAQRPGKKAIKAKKASKSGKAARETAGRKPAAGAAKRRRAAGRR